MTRPLHEKQLLRDESGMAATEFGLIIIPLTAVLLASFDLGYQSYVQSVMQGALYDVARRAAVENPVFSEDGDTIEEQIEEAIETRVNGIARDATYTINQSNYFDFSSVGNPEKLMTDNNGNGEYDADDDDCFEDMNGNGEYDTDAGQDGIGGANDVSYYDVTVTMPRLVPVGGFYGVSDDYVIHAQAAIRNQPYDDQPTPAILCSV